MKNRNRHSKTIYILAVLAVLVVIGAGVLIWHSRSRTDGTAVATGRTGTETVSTLDEQAREKVRSMSPQQRVGQLMMIGIQGTTVDQDAAYQIAQYHMGNVILFDRNMQSTQQVKDLNAALARQIRRQSQDIPPFIAVDQEGGFVLRMRDAFPRVPSEQQLGENGDPAAARTWAVTTGKKLKELGFNLNFAPVVDLGSASERSYSRDPAVVTSFAREAVEGYEEAKIWCALKHFPGIGKVRTDPHLDGDQVAASRDELLAADMKPFADLIGQVPHDKMFIMVSNVTFPALDPKLPACVSQPIMTGILRQQFGYGGLILSDDMEMGAMAKHYAFSDMGVMAIRAGADIVLVCHDYGHEQETYAGLLKAYENDESFRKLVDEKVTRIVRTKLAGGEAGYM